MNYEDKIDKCIDYLLESVPQYKDQKKLLNNAEDKRKFMRALMNINLDLNMDEEYFRIQDEILQEETRIRGTVNLSDMEEVKKNIYLWQGDICRLETDAIVNAANSAMLGCFHPLHGCIDNVIHSAAGLQLRLACREVMEEQGHPEPTGKAKITEAYNLPSKKIIHTVGPIVSGDLTKELEEDLKNSYLSCMKLAEENNLKSIAFCCISTGEFRFPPQRAAEIAIETVSEYLKSSDLKVVFNVYKDSDLAIYEKMLGV